MTAYTAQDLALVQDVIDARPQAWEQLVHRVADTVWTACRILTGDDDDARAAFADVVSALAADDFRRLRAFNGASRIEAFVALISRDVLAERLMRLFTVTSGATGWTAFERFFSADINRIIARRLPGNNRLDARKDAYQDICLGLIADNYRRLRAYSGSGSFNGFVLHMADRLLIDFIRRTIIRHRSSDTDDKSEMEDIASAQSSPEEAVLEQEDARLLTLAALVMRQAAKDFSEAEQVYLHIILGGGEAVPAREAARLMGRPVGEIYKIKQRVMTRLREALSRSPAIRVWRESA